MTNKIAAAAAAVVAAVTVAGAARAADAQVYVVHGIRGEDLGAAPELPVDVEVGGACAIPGFLFGAVVGPVVVAEGTVNVKISLANEATPCSNAAVIDADVPFASGEFAAVVAHLDASGAPTASKFRFDSGPTTAGKGRVVLAHTAAAGDVNVSLKKSKPKRIATVPGLANGEAAVLPLEAGDYKTLVKPSAKGKKVLGPATLTFDADTVTLVFVVGSAENKTVTVVIEEVATPSGGSPSAAFID